MAERPNKITVLKPKLTWRRIRDGWPWMIWVGMIVLVLYMFKSDVDFKRMNGVISTDLEPIAPLEAGRVVKINFGIGDRVAKNEVIAEMDTSLIDSEIAQWKQRKQEDKRVASMELLESNRRFSLSVENTLDTEAQIDFDLQRDQMEVNRLTSLIEQIKKNMGIWGGVRALQEAEGQLTAYDKRVELQKNRLKRAQEATARALAMKKAFDEQLTKDNNDGSEQQFSSIDKAIELLVKRRNSMKLFATKDGTIGDILVSEGDVVRPGDRVAEIVVSDTERVIGFLPEDASREIQTGTQMPVDSPEDPSKGFPTKVTAISPHIIAKTDMQSPLQNRVVRGRKVVLEMPKIPEGESFLPGQTVIIHTKNPGSTGFLSILRIFD